MYHTFITCYKTIHRHNDVNPSSNEPTRGSIHKLRHGITTSQNIYVQSLLDQYTNLQDKEYCFITIKK